jgi:hypothetical protein
MGETAGSVLSRIPNHQSRRRNRLARWTYQETAGEPLRRVRWKLPPDFTAAVRISVAQNQGETFAEVGEVPEPF